MSTNRRRRRLRNVALIAAAAAAVLFVVVFWPHQRGPVSGFAVFAHRGVHQPVRGDIARHETPIAMDACTAQLVEPTSHGFIENTLPAIDAAFASGATIVEVDIHLSADAEVVVFHDYYLDCRTDAKARGCRRALNRGKQRCLIGDQPLSLLKTLDVGYGYRIDGGKTFPLRGTGVGMMPTLRQVLTAFPDRQFVLDVKGGRKDLEAVAGLLRGMSPEARALVSWYNLDPDGEARALEAAPGTEIAISSVMKLRSCASWYLTTGWVGFAPARCRNLRFLVPRKYLVRLGPLTPALLRKVHLQSSTVVVAFVDTAEQAAYFDRYDIDGVFTNYVEVVGPVLRARIGR